MSFKRSLVAVASLTLALGLLAGCETDDANSTQPEEASPGVLSTDGGTCPASGCSSTCIANKDQDA